MGLYELHFRNGSGAPGSVTLPYFLALEDSFVEFCNLVPEGVSYVLVVAVAVPVNGIEETLSEFVIYEVLVAPEDVCSALF